MSTSSFALETGCSDILQSFTDQCPGKISTKETGKDGYNCDIFSQDQSLSPPN